MKPLVLPRMHVHDCAGMAKLPSPQIRDNAKTRAPRILLEA
jgi:hypothetical protein